MATEMFTGSTLALDRTVSVVEHQKQLQYQCTGKGVFSSETLVETGREPFPR